MNYGGKEGTTSWLAKNTQCIHPGLKSVTQDLEVRSQDQQVPDNVKLHP
jgi:hypothetical protein